MPVPVQHDLRHLSGAAQAVVAYGEKFYIKTANAVKTIDVAILEPALINADITAQMLNLPAPVAWAAGTMMTTVRMTPFVNSNGLHMILQNGSTSVQIVSPTIVTNQLVISTRTYAQYGLHLCQVTDSLMLAAYFGDANGEFWCRTIELSGSTLSLGTEYRLPFFYAVNDLVSGSSSQAFVGMLGNSEFVLVSVLNVGQYNIPLRVVSKNVIEPALEVGLTGEYLGLVSSATPTTATIKLGPVAGGLTGLTSGSECFVSEPGGLTSVNKPADTRVGRALSTTSIRQRGPLVD
jgi:hypothetical protein